MAVGVVEAERGGEVGFVGRLGFRRTCSGRRLWSDADKGGENRMVSSVSHARVELWDHCTTGGNSDLKMLRFAGGCVGSDERIISSPAIDV